MSRGPIWLVRLVAILAFVSWTGGCKSSEEKQREACLSAYRQLKPRLEPELTAAEAALRQWNDAGLKPEKMPTPFRDSAFRARQMFDASMSSCYLALAEDGEYQLDETRVSNLARLADGLPRWLVLRAGTTIDDVDSLVTIADAAEKTATRLGNVPALAAIGAEHPALRARLDSMQTQHNEAARAARSAENDRESRERAAQQAADARDCDDLAKLGLQAMERAEAAGCVDARGEPDVSRSDCAGTVAEAIRLSNLFRERCRR